MSVVLSKDSKIVVQGATGYQGQFHIGQMKQFGTNVVAGVTPGKGGEKVHDVPVFDTVAEAVQKAHANVSLIFVPAPFAKDAVIEAVDAGVKVVIVITEHIPVHDAAVFVNYAKSKGVTLIGPNCPGACSPGGKSKVGILPGPIATAGPVGLVSRSGTLTYEVVYQLTQAGIGQTTCVGIGGDPINGTSFIDCLEAFEADPETRAVVMIGEIGGTDEQEAADFVSAHMSKPVVGFIAGQTAPPGRRMGHAGAIISGSAGTAAEKIEAFQRNGIGVARRPSDVVGLVQEVL